MSHHVVEAVFVMAFNSFPPLADGRGIDSATEVFAGLGEYLDKLQACGVFAGKQAHLPVFFLPFSFCGRILLVAYLRATFIKDFRSARIPRAFSLSAHLI